MQSDKNSLDIEIKILNNKEIMTYDKAVEKVNKAKYSSDIETLIMKIWKYYVNVSLYQLNDIYNQIVAVMMKQRIHYKKISEFSSIYKTKKSDSILQPSSSNLSLLTLFTSTQNSEL